MEKKGSSRKKNQHAEKILRKLLREATWINIHRLPVYSLMISPFFATKIFSTHNFCRDSTILSHTRYELQVDMEYVGGCQTFPFEDFSNLRWKVTMTLIFTSDFFSTRVFIFFRGVMITHFRWSRKRLDSLIRRLKLTTA
jgi:hypothetical protein